MVRERIKELVDFATTESPYRDANKGWLNDDVYLEFGSSPKSASSKGVELANVSIFWKPLNKLANILLGVVLLATIFVFTTVSMAHGKFQNTIDTSMPMPNADPIVKQIVEKELQSDNLQQSETNLPTPETSIVQKEVESSQSIKTSDFAAAALGGKKVQS